MSLHDFIELLNSNLNYIIYTAIGLMIIFFVLELKSFKQEVFKDYKPIIISTGVVGTFIGIFLGLWEFNTKNIAESVPSLLEGLKMAFITSIVGMFFSIVLSVIENWNKKESSDISDILINIRKDINSQFKTLNESLNNSMKNVSQGATNEVINALNGIISDFNTNLKEQFGENFKQLNEAVKKMIEWQETYKTSIETLETNLKRSINNIEKTANYTEQFSKNYEKISEVSNRLKSILEVNQKQINDMEEHLTNLSKIGKEANLITQSINDFSKAIQKSLSEQSAGLNNLNKELSSQTETSLGNLNKALTSLTDKFRTDYENYLNKFKELLDKLKVNQ